MMARIILASILALLLTSMFFTAVETGSEIERSSSDFTPRSAVNGQNPVVVASKPKNVTADNGPADSGVETNLPWNRYLLQSVPFHVESGQPNGSVSGRIHQPGLFPIFYDGIGGPSGLACINAAQDMVAAASAAGT
jgi:hypothetical protein